MEDSVDFLEKDQKRLCGVSVEPSTTVGEWWAVVGGGTGTTAGTCTSAMVRHW